MTRLNLDKEIEDLNSTQIEKQIPALEQASEIINTLAIKAVDALKTGENRFLVAKRLSSLGSVVIPHLKKLLAESDESEIKVLAAFVLVKFNSNIGIPILLDTVINDEEYAGLAAEYLAKLGVNQAIGLIVQRLSSTLSI